MKFHVPRVYPLTDVRLTGLSHAQQVRELIAGGATLVQLREKHSSPREFCEQARAALQVARECGVPLLINDRVDIALAIGADGVHLGQDDLPPAAARQLLGPNAIIGYSTHNLEQAQLAANLPVDYIAIGPIFQTRSKEKPDPVVGLDGLRKVREVITKLPLVAIGGIDHTNAQAVINAGADSVAVINSVLVPSNTISANISSLIQLLQL